MQSSSTQAPARIKIQTPGAHHVTLRVSDYDRAKNFYIDTLGFDVVLETSNLFIFFAGKTAIAIRGPEDETVRHGIFNPYRVGLDHLAFACENEAELERVAKALDANSVENTGIKIDGTLGKKYVAFKDPDRIALELYMV